MRQSNKVQNSGTFVIESYGNGFAFSIVRRADGKIVFLQGDDAVRFSRELEQMTLLRTFFVEMILKISTRVHRPPNCTFCFCLRRGAGTSIVI